MVWNAENNLHCRYEFLYNNSEFQTNHKYGVVKNIKWVLEWMIKEKEEE